MTLELYNAAQSTCSQKVRLVLHEKGLDFVDHRLRLFAGDQLKEEYLKINPNGVVPALVHDGEVIIESSVIVEYLDEVFPDAGLAPADAAGRAHMRTWQRFIDEVPTPAVRYPSYNQAFASHFRDMDEAEFERIAAAKPLRKHFFRKFARTGFTREMLDEAEERVALTASRMDAALQEGKWLAGARITLADFCMLPLIDRADDVGLGHLWAERPGVIDWYGRMRARPS
ncbi:MAG: glutathione S-transferase family protein, partial [Alphaproteobacteria bacterium]|nr:glutathione S-transferase family protein [Alphaproteobacteria bacterium]